MASIALNIPKARPFLALLAISIGLASPLITEILSPWLISTFPHPFERFASLWIPWIAVAFAIFVSVRLEGISLSTFGLGKSETPRSLRYRLIEIIAALIIGLVITIVLVLFSNAVRAAINIPMDNRFSPESILPAWILIPAWVTGFFTEEFLFRAYPIERLGLLLGNRWLAAGISVFAFVILHWLSWDWVHVLTVVMPGGILLTGIYLWRRSLLFVMIIHAVFNVPLLFLPFIAPYL